MIAIVDYGAGNLKSVKKAFDFLDVKCKIVSSSQELQDADKVVLPGVGAFGAAIARLHESRFFDSIKEWIANDKPFIGICLGMQLLFERSAESEGVEGLGAFKGENLKFTEGKVPQIGWNQIQIKKKSKLFDGIEDGSFFYFLHGYYIAPENDSIMTATTGYSINYPSIIFKIFSRL